MRARFYDILYVIDAATGAFKPAANGTATLYEDDTTDPLVATIYAAGTGGSTLSNPVTADSDGALEFYLDVPQDVNMLVTAPGLGSITIPHARVEPSWETPRTRQFAVGDAFVPDGNLFLVNETTSDNIGQSASIETNVTAGTGGDYSALRVVMREMTTANNQSHAAEIHGLWTSGDGSQFRSALTVTAQGTMSGDTGVQQNALRIISVPAVWGMVGGQDMDNAILIQQGDADFLAFLRAYDKTGALKALWEKDGKITAGHLMPLAGSTYDLGSAAGALYYRAVYAQNVLVSANGSAVGPTLAFINDTTSGHYLIASNRLGRSINSTLVEELNSGGVIQKQAVTVEPISDPAVPSSGVKIWQSTDGYAYGTTSAGLVRGVATNDRERFLAALLTLCGDVRLLWLPSPGTTTTTTDESLTGRTLTYDATIAARLSRLGIGQAVTFNGSSQYANTPDTANLSFGNGTTDSAMSLVFVGNVTNTAAQRMILSKYGALGSGTGAEWQWMVHSDDTLILEIVDDSAGVACFRQSSAAITMGSTVMLGATYSGVGGASAGNGMALYQNGLAITSSASNNASYVAMEDKTAVVELGSRAVHSSAFFQGSMSLVVLCQKQLSASEMWAIYRIAKWYFSL